jgi:hypothetical protein
MHFVQRLGPWCVDYGGAADLGAVAESLIWFPTLKDLSSWSFPAVRNLHPVEQEMADDLDSDFDSIYFH